MGCGIFFFKIEQVVFASSRSSTYDIAKKAVFNIESVLCNISAVILC
jgi:hypothetical protein